MISASTIPKRRGTNLWKFKYLFVLVIAVLAMTLALAVPADALTTYSSNADGYIYSDSAVYTSAQSASTGTVYDENSLYLRVGQNIQSNAEFNLVYNKVHQVGGSSEYSRVGQKVSGFSGTITRVDLYLGKSNTSATGTGYCRVYNADTNTLIGTVGSVDVTAITGASTITFNTTPVTVTSPTNIIICFEYSGSYAIDIKAYSPSTTVWGHLSRYNGSTWSDLTSDDLMFSVEYKSYRVNRSFLYFDTSSIPAGATITNATLSLYGDTNGSDTDFSLSITNGQPTYPSIPLTGGDFALSHYTTGGGELSTSGFVTYGYNTITLTTAGKGWINKGGTTKLGLFSSRDIGGNTPTGDEYVIFRSGNSSVRPYLYIEYTLPAPTVTTQAVTDITTTTATGNGNVTSDGGSTVTERGIVWATTSNPTTSSSGKVVVVGTTGAFSGAITGLTPGTLYHVRAYATNSAGTSYGEDVTFSAHKLPTVTTQAVSSIGITTATGNGNVTDLGVPSPTQYGVVWNTTGSPTLADSHTSQGAVSSTGAFTSSMTGLTASTTYYVRAYATNAAGTAYGNEVSFTTSEGTLTVDNASVDGYSSVCVSPSGTVTVDVRTTLTGLNWSSTQYQIEGQEAVNVDTTNFTSDGPQNVSFNITAPATHGTYDLTLIAYEGEGSTGNYSSFTLTDAIKVGIFGDSFGLSDTLYVNRGWTENEVSLNLCSIGTVPGTVSGGSNNGYLKINNANVVKSGISTVGLTDIHLHYTWGQETYWPFYGSLIVEWKLSSSSSWNTVNTYSFPDTRTTNPDTNSVDVILTGAGGSSIDIRFKADGLDWNDYVRVDNVLVTGTPAPYTVTYNGNGSTGGSVPIDNTAYYQGDTVTVLGNTNGLTKTNCVFNGWNTKADGSGTHYQANDTFTMGTADVTLYAMWAVLDQNNSTTGTGLPVSYTCAQTFTAGKTGDLTTISYYSNNNFSTTITVEIQGVTSSGMPNGTILATNTVTLSASPSYRWVNIKFPEPCQVIAGKQYAIVWHGYSSASQSGIGITTGNAYVNGAPFGYSSSWSALTDGYDFLFKTYVYETAVTPEVPTVSTQAVTGITTTTATGNGNVTSDGASAITERGIVWSTTVNPTTANNKVTAAGTTGAFTGDITGLTPGTLYHVRAYATNSVGTSYGNDVTFTAHKLPAVTTQAVSSIGTTTATGNGNITDLGVPNPTQHGVVWNTTGTPTTSDSHTAQGAVSTAGAFTSSITGLTGSTTYYVRAYATNAAGTVYANEVSFTTTTPATAPTVTTQAVTGITTTTATGNGTVTSDGGSAITERGIVWGASVNPTTSDSKVTADGTTGAFTGDITGLTPGTLYHVRAYATNAIGTSYGNDVTFTTYELLTVTYDGNGSTGGTPPTDSNTYYTGDLVTVLGNTGSLVKTGYSFGGWNTAADGSGTSYTAGNTFSMGTANVTLYAKWTINQYTVSFDSQGGSAVTSQTVDYGNLVTEPTAPTREGHTFAGWYTDTTYDTAWNFGTDTVTANITLYAKWTVNQYTITFNSNGGSSVTAITQDYGTTVSAPADPTKTGYTFAGWYSDAGLASPYTFSTMPAENITLYAKWTINQYTVSFDSQGGSAVSSQTVDYGGLVTEPTAPTREGYTFGGWYTDTNYATAWNFGTDTVTANITLYAKWTVNQYTITFDSNGGSSVTAITQDYGTAVSAPADPTMTGYTFAGWYSDADLTIPYTFSTMPAENITLYAKWTINQYTVSFDSQGGSAVNSQTVDYGGLVTEPTAPTRQGYTFEGWYTDTNYGTAWNFTTDTVTSDITLYAKWTVNQYTITFDSNGGSSVTAITQDYGTAVSAPADPTRTGYTFAGWYSDAGLTTPYTFSTMPAENITLYAKWTINQYTVSFDSQGGGAVTSQTIDYGGLVTEPTAPTREGYTFGGWYKEPACTTAWNFGTDTVTANITLYAKWTINQYTITFNSNGGSSVTAITQDYGTAVSAPADPTMTGYTFAGWYSDADLTIPYTFSTMPAENITLYAKWTINQYTVSFDSQGGSAVTSQTVDHGGLVTEPTAPTREGYTFGGWYTDTNYTTTWDFATDTVTSDITLYAKWTINDQAPIITTQPQDTAVAVGEQASFTVEYTGYPEPALQWQVSNNKGKKWSDIDGANSDTYTTPAASPNMNDYRYRVILSNDLGSVTSEAATLTVNKYTEAPAVTAHPEDQTVIEGQTATFSAAASGIPTPTVQWQLSTDSGAAWDDISGATSTTYTTAATSLGMNGYKYRAVFTNTAGTATTDAATLTVEAAVPAAMADVSITKNGQYNQESKTITWTMTVTNNGPESAEDVTVTDRLAKGTCFESIDLADIIGSTYSVRGSNVVVNVGQLENGASVTFTIKVKVVRATSPVYNTASVTTTSCDSVLDNNSDTCECTW